MHKAILERRETIQSLMRSGFSLEQADAVAQVVYDLNMETVGAVRDELRSWNARISLWLLLLGFALVTSLVAVAPLAFL